jgi:hypothetical protein
MDIRNTRQSTQSIASRLFQFALNGTQSQPEPESYTRLRDQLFPSNIIPTRTRITTPNGRRQEYTRQRSNASMHPSFRSKAVCKLECSFCDRTICSRGMKAILLADTSVLLFN